MKVNWACFPRRVLQYFGGLVVMAMGVVLMKRVDLGISPITAVPAAVSAIDQRSPAVRDRTGSALRTESASAS